MATLKRRLARKNAEGVYEPVHLETSADLVIRNSSTVDADLTSLENSVNTLKNTPSGASVVEITFLASAFSSGVLTIPASQHKCTDGRFAYNLFYLDNGVYRSGNWATTGCSVSWSSDQNILITASAGFDGKICIVT